MSRESGSVKVVFGQKGESEGKIPGLAQQAGRSVLFLGIRQLVVQASNLIGTIMLARALSTEQFGVFAIVGFSVTFLTTFGDAGLAASLVRQPQEPIEADYRAVFTAQQILIAVVALLVWILSSTIATAYRIPVDGVWLFRLLALALLVTSFQTMSVVKLERNLNFFWLAVAETVQAIVFNISIIIFTLKGAGVIGFGFSVLLRAMTGTIIVFLAAPWRISWCLDFPRIGVHLKFGIPFQGIAVISLIKDSINPIFIGFLINASAVGQINWAQTLASYPVMALMLFQRIYLPVFSKLQRNMGDLGLFLSQVVILTNTVVAPLAMTTLFFAEPIIRNFFGEKWIPFLPLFYFFWVGNLVVPTITPIFGVITAVGNSKLAFGFALMWMVATWLIGAPLTYFFGTAGFAFASLGIQLTNYFVYRYALSIANFKVSPKILYVWLIALIINATSYLLGKFFDEFENGVLVIQFSLVAILYLYLVRKLKIIDLDFLKTFR